MDKASLERKGYSIAALRALARKELPRMLFDMVDGAAGDEITMRNNEAALAALELVPTLLAGAPTRDQSVELFGVKLPSPVIIGPTGLAGLLWPHAELAAARAAARFGTIYCTSHASTATIEEIGAATPGPKWMQMFLYKDRGLTAEFAARAAAAGYKGLILTVDNQVVAGRDRDARNGMTLSAALGSAQRDRLSEPARMAHAHARDALADLRQLRQADLDRRLRPADDRAARSGCRLERCRTAARAMARAAHPQGPAAPGRSARGGQLRRRWIIVSNHGGRQLDGAVASIRALPGVVEAVGGRAPVLIDGGFRRGIDVVKALALGARAV